MFRIGGDEFAVILRDQDFEGREELLFRLRRQVEENVQIGEGPVVASGLAEYHPGEDRSVEEVFDRADSQMYEDKSRLKEMQMRHQSRLFTQKKEIKAITEDRRIMLDTLYNAFDVVAEGAYVFLCDMKYDFSRWSKVAVDTFGLPSEYMYGAGDIWENRIHPEDREAYHKGIVRYSPETPRATTCGIGRGTSPENTTCALASEWCYATPLASRITLRAPFAITACKGLFDVFAGRLNAYLTLRVLTSAGR